MSLLCDLDTFLGCHLKMANGTFGGRKALCLGRHTSALSLRLRTALPRHRNLGRKQNSSPKIQRIPKIVIKLSRMDSEKYSETLWIEF